MGHSIVLGYIYDTYKILIEDRIFVIKLFNKLIEQMDPDNNTEDKLNNIIISEPEGPDNIAKTLRGIYIYVVIFSISDIYVFIIKVKMYL